MRAYKLLLLLFLFLIDSGHYYLVTVVKSIYYKSRTKHLAIEPIVILGTFHFLLHTYHADSNVRYRRNIIKKTFSDNT